MKKQEILEIFTLLEGAEFIRFGEYIHSVYFKVPERIIKLYDIINEKKIPITEGKLTRKEIASMILKKRTTDPNIRKLFSDLNREVEAYLCFEYFRNQKLHSELLLIKQYRDKGNYSKARQLACGLIKQVSKLPPGGETYGLKAEISAELNLMEEDSEFYKYSESLQSESDNLDAYYLTKKLFLFQLMYSKEKLNNFRGVKYSANMFGEILGFIEKEQKKIKEKYPDIYLKYLMLKMLGSANEEIILEYRELLDSDSTGFTLEQLSGFYSDLYNYLNIRIEEGDHYFRRPLFDLYVLLDKKDMLYDNGIGKIHLFTYKQIIDTALHQRETEWAEYFAEKYSRSIEDENRKNIVNLEYAKISFYKNDYKKAREYIAKVDYRDYIHYLDAKLFLLCIEYDSGNYDDAELIMDSALKYIKNNPDIPETSSGNTKRTIRLMKKLFGLKENGSDEYDLRKLESELDSEKGFIYALNWMKEKTAELRKTR